MLTFYFLKAYNINVEQKLKVLIGDVPARILIFFASNLELFPTKQFAVNITVNKIFEISMFESNCMIKQNPESIDI